jgi:CRP/FNR family transcriptional regulator, nitrogen fixation regulation protein
MAIAKEMRKSPTRKRVKRSTRVLLKSGRDPIEAMGSSKLLPRKEKVFRRGQSARHIYKVEFGCIRTYTSIKGRRLVFAFYFPGDYFGLEMRPKHHVSAETVTPSMVRAIKIESITARAATDFSVAEQMLRVTNIELQRVRNHSLLLLRSSADERLGDFLFEMKKRGRSKEVNLLMSRQDIADHLNLTIETVSRALTRLEKASVITFLSHRRVTVHVRKPLAA